MASGTATTRTIKLVIDGSLVKKESDKINRSLNSISKSAKQTAGAMQTIAALGRLVFAVRTIERMGRFAIETALAAESVDLLAKKMEVLTKDVDAFSKVMSSANTVGMRFSELGGVIGRFAVATQNAFRTDEMIKWTEGIVKAGRLVGSTQKEIGSGLIQLSQGLSSAASGGGLMGDEFRSVMENLPLLALAIKKEFEGATESLKELASQGKISAEITASAMKRLAESMEGIPGLTDTISARLARIDNAWSMLLNTLMDSTNNWVIDTLDGITTVMNYFSDSIAERTDKITDAAKIALVTVNQSLVETTQNLKMAEQGLTFLQEGKPLSGALGTVAKFLELDKVISNSNLAGQVKKVAELIKLRDDLIKQQKNLIKAVNAPEQLKADKAASERLKLENKIYIANEKALTLVREVNLEGDKRAAIIEKWTATRSTLNKLLLDENLASETLLAVNIALDETWIKQDVALAKLNKKKKESNDLTGDACERIRDDLTCLQKLNHAYDEVSKAAYDREQDVLDLDHALAKGAITQDVYTERLFDIEETYDAVVDTGEVLVEEIDEVTSAFEKMLKVIEEDSLRHLEGFFADILKGEEDAFENFTDRILDMWIDMVAEMAVQALMGNFTFNVSGGSNVAGTQTGGVGTSTIAGSSGFKIEDSLDTLIQGGDKLYDWITGASAQTTMITGVPQAAGVMGPTMPTGVVVNGAGTATSIGSSISPGMAAAGVGVVGGLVASKVGGTQGAVAGVAAGYAASIALGVSLGPVGWAALAASAIFGSGMLDSTGDTTPDLNITGYGGGDSKGLNLITTGEEDGTYDPAFGYTGKFGSIYASTQHDAFQSEAEAIAFAQKIADSFKASEDILSSVMGEELTDLVASAMKNMNTGELKAEEGADWGNTVDSVYRSIFGGAMDAAAKITENQDWSVWKTLTGDLTSVIYVTSEYVKSTGDLRNLYEEMFKVHNKNADVIAEQMVNLQSVNSIMEMLNVSTYEISISGANAANALVKAAGGLAQLVDLTNYFFSTFYTAQEQAAYYTNAYADAINDLNEKYNTSISSSTATYKASTKAILANEGASADLKVAMLELAPVAAQVIQIQQQSANEALAIRQQEIDLYNEYIRSMKEFVLSLTEMIMKLEGASELEKLNYEMDVYLGLLGLSRDALDVSAQGYADFLKTLDYTNPAVIALQDTFIGLGNTILAVADETKRLKDVQDLADAKTAELKRENAEAGAAFNETMRELTYTLGRENDLDNTIRNIIELQTQFGYIGSHATYTTKDLSNFVIMLDGLDEGTRKAENSILELANAMMHLEDIIHEAQQTIDSILSDQRISVIDEQIRLERERLDLITESGETALEQYEAQIEANKKLKEFIDDLSISDLKNQTSFEKMTAAGGLFDSAVASGDSDKAMDYATDYLQAARVIYTSSDDYENIVNKVESGLEGMIKNVTSPGTSTLGESSYLSSLESEKLALEDEYRKAALHEQNLELINAMNNMALAKDESLTDIMIANNINTWDLIGTLTTLNDKTIFSIVKWAIANDKTSTELSDQSGIDYNRLIVLLSDQGVLLNDIKLYDEQFVEISDLTYKRMVEIAVGQRWSTKVMADKFGTTQDVVKNYIVDGLGVPLQAIEDWDAKIYSESITSNTALKAISDEMIMLNRSDEVTEAAVGYGGLFTDNELLHFIGESNFYNGKSTAEWLSHIAANTFTIGYNAIALNSLLGASSSVYGNVGYLKGTNFVPEDQFAFLHEGEAVIPARYNAQLSNYGVSTNPVQNNAEIISEMKELKEEISSLRKDQNNQTNAIIISNNAANERNAKDIINSNDTRKKVVIK